MSLFLLASCQKSDNPKVPEITAVPFPLLVKDAKTDLTITAQTPASFNAKFDVGLMFPGGEIPSKFDVVIRKNEVNTAVKTFKADVTTFPSTLGITGAELIALFGPIVLGDRFDVGVDITTKDGAKFLAFPTVGVPYGTGVSAAAGASVVVRYEAICKYTAAEYAGNFEVVTDGWADFGVGTVIPVTVVSEGKLSFVSPVSGKAIIVDVNTATNAVSVAKQEYGDYKAAGIDSTWPYGMASVASVNSANNFVAPCDLVLSMQLSYTVSAGGFGNYTLKLKKVR